MKSLRLQHSRPIEVCHYRLYISHHERLITNIGSPHGQNGNVLVEFQTVRLKNRPSDKECHATPVGDGDLFAAQIFNPLDLRRRHQVVRQVPNETHHQPAFRALDDGHHAPPPTQPHPPRPPPPHPHTTPPSTHPPPPP